MPISRREFIGTSTAAATLGLGIGTGPARGGGFGGHLTNILRLPDSVAARTASGEMVPLSKGAGGWSASGLSVRTEPDGRGAEARLPVVVESARNDLGTIRLRWRAPVGADPLILSDAWERAYGDLRWQGLVPERVMPWYFVLRHGKSLSCYGVETQPGTFCFWQCDQDGVSLWLDLRNGGEPAQLSGRRLTACHVIMVESAMQRPVEPLLHAFCTRLCPSPRLPKVPIVGSNDWNYAYGKNTAEGILRDARLMTDLAPDGYRPFVVIDDGWQDKRRFPSLTNLAAQIRGVGARPGIWIRPLRADKTPAGPLLPASRFGTGKEAAVSAYDISVPAGLDAALQGMREARRQGYEFIKHDFSTYDLLGQWGREMGAQPALPGWHFADQTRTTAEIVLDFYRSLRREAGDDCIILGCNTFGHLAAGIFESQRIADDTSGQQWERTRRYGVNGLSFRISQHRAFYHADPDIVAVTRDIPWSMTRQWMDVVARSGTSLFIAPQPEAITQEARSAIRSAMAIAVKGASGYPVDSMNSTTPEEWAFTGGDGARQHYRWCEPGGADPFG